MQHCRFSSSLRIYQQSCVYSQFFLRYDRIIALLRGGRISSVCRKTEWSFRFRFSVIFSNSICCDSKIWNRWKADFQMTMYRWFGRYIHCPNSILFINVIPIKYKYKIVPNIPKCLTMKEDISSKFLLNSELPSFLYCWILSKYFLPIINCVVSSNVNHLT